MSNNEIKQEVNNQTSNSTPTNVGEQIIDEQLALNELKKKYSKINPFCYGIKNSNKKWFNTTYLTVKLVLVLLIGVFGLIALWYTTQWKVNTISNLGLGFDTLTVQTISKINATQIENSTDWVIKSIEYTKVDLSAYLNDELYKTMLTKGLGDFATAGSNYNIMINALIAMSFVGIIFIIPSLSFKHGTLFSTISLSVVFISFISVIVMFSILFSYQMDIVSSFKAIAANSTASINGIEVDKTISNETYNNLTQLQQDANDAVTKNLEDLFAKYKEIILGANA